MKQRRNVPIVGDGAIANPDLGDGRIVPVLIVDCEGFSALEDLISLHQGLPPGDVVSMWGLVGSEVPWFICTLILVVQ